MAAAQSSIPNYNCAETFNKETGACTRAMYAWDSKIGQCKQPAADSVWNYAGNAMAQLRCPVEDALTSDFLRGEPLPDALSLENKSRNREYTVQNAAPARLKTGALSMAYGGPNTGMYATPVNRGEAFLVEMVAGGLAAKTYEAEYMLRGTPGGPACPPGSTNAAAQGFPYLGPAALGMPPGYGNGCLPQPNVDASSYTQLNTAVPSANMFMSYVEQYPPAKPPQLNAPKVIQNASDAFIMGVNQMPVASFAPQRPVNFLCPIGTCGNTSTVQFA